MVERVRTPDGFRLVLRAEPGIGDSLRALVAREQQCCGWASWAVSDDGRQLVLDVTGPAPRIDNLAGAFGL